MAASAKLTVSPVFSQYVAGSVVTVSVEFFDGAGAATYPPDATVSVKQPDGSIIVCTGTALTLAGALYTLPIQTGEVGAWSVVAYCTGVTVTAAFTTVAAGARTGSTPVPPQNVAYLPAASALTGGEMLDVLQGGVPVRVTLGQIAALVPNGSFAAGNVGTGLQAGGAGGYTTVSVVYGTTPNTAAAGNDSRITGAEQTTNKGAKGGYAPLDGNATVPYPNLPVGPGASQVCAGTDGRLTPAVPSLAALRAAPGGFAAQVHRQGYAAVGDGGDARYAWSATSTAADDGVTAITPTGSTGAGRWLIQFGARLSVNVLWCGAKGDGATDDTAAFTLARTVANALGVPIYVPGRRFKVTWSIADNADLWLVGEGTLLWAQAATCLSVVRTPGAAIAISGLAPVTLGTVSGNAYTDEAVVTWTLQGIPAASLPGISAGQVYSLNSQDVYPWALASVINGSGSGTLQVWQAQLVRIQGLCIPFSSSSAGFAEDQTVTGATSGAVAQVRSVSGTTAGYLVVSSLSAAFTSGENLLVGGSTAGTCTGAAIVAIAEKIVDTYTTSPQIQLFTPCRTIIDGLTFDVPTGANVEAVIGSANRLPGLIIANCLHPVVRNVTCMSGWTRFLQSLGSWRGDYDISVRYLPNDANVSEAAYGYGVELAGSDTGARVRVMAYGCRHAFTTNVNWGGYAYMPLQTRGNPRDFLVYGSLGRDCFNAPFDTHWGCYGGRFEGCRADWTNHLNRNVAASIGFQNRGFNTSYSGCLAVGCVNGFVEGGTNLGLPAPPSGQPAYLSTIFYVACQALDFQLNGFLGAVANTGGASKIELQSCIARGDGRAVNAPYYQSAFNFQLSNYVRLAQCEAQRFNAVPMQFAGGGRIELIDCVAYYRDNPGVTSGIRFNSAPSETYISNYRVYSDTTTSSPAGLFRFAGAGSMTIGLSGFVGCINIPSTPLTDAASTGALVYAMAAGRVNLAALSAAGTTQATGTAITAQVNTFTTVAAGAGATLPSSAAIGSEVVIFNRGANALLVYPPSGGSIESGAANAAVSVAAGGTARFTRETTTQWRQG